MAAPSLSSVCAVYVVEWLRGHCRASRRLRFLPFLFLADEPPQSAIAGCYTLQRRCQFAVAMAAPQPAAAARGQKLPCFLRPNRPDPRRRRDEGTAQPRRTPLLAAQPRRGRWRRPTSGRRRRRGGAGEDDRRRAREKERVPCADAESDTRAYICALRSSFYQLVKIYQVIWQTVGDRFCVFFQKKQGWQLSLANSWRC